MTLIVFSSCAPKLVIVPYDKVIRSVNEACSHEDKGQMKCLYDEYLYQIFDMLSTCREKGLLKDEKEGGSP